MALDREYSIKQFYDIVEKLKEHVDGALDQLIDDNDNFNITEKASENFQEMLDYLDKLSIEEENVDFIKELVTDNSSHFWASVSDMYETRLETYRELMFIRKLKFDKFKSLVDHTVKNYIVVNNRIEPLGKYTREQLGVTIKFLKTCVDIIIEKLYSKTAYKEILSDYFVIDNEQNEYIWEVIMQYQNDLRYKALIEHLQRIQHIEDGNI